MEKTILERIREALEDKSTKLDLYNNQFTEIPPEIGQLSNLTRLNLDSNKLTELPSDIGKLTNLTELDLYNNQLTEIPPEIGQLSNLTRMDLSGNKLTELPPKIGQLSNLASLDLYNNQLKELPPEIGQLSNLTGLHLRYNQFKELPPEMGQLSNLTRLDLSGNQLTEIPPEIGQLSNLTSLVLSGNQLTEIPPEIGQLSNLTSLVLYGNKLTEIPTEIGQLSNLTELDLSGNKLTEIPTDIGQLSNLTELDLSGNPLNPELAATYEDGVDAIKRYLRAKAQDQVVLNEAKLILIGEGAVGKSCLLGALRGDPWEEGRPTTHGIEIKQVKVIDPDSSKEITLNGWDFGGQRVYRPTHQLFFSAPAVYLVVWKPREGPQQGFVKEWIKLVKHREPDSKILIVATHGGPKERQPDIDRQEIWDLFGKDMVLDFFLVESKPDEKQERRGIADLKQAIARVAAGLSEMGRTVPKKWADARTALKDLDTAYLQWKQMLEFCAVHNMDEEQANDFVRISHRLGHLIHYEHDPVLRDIVVLKPDWLATAVSFVLDDAITRSNHGLVTFKRMGELWNDEARKPEFRYPPELHKVFQRLMERFDLSYRVPGSPLGGEPGETSLIAQLVSDIKPVDDLALVWPPRLKDGEEEQVQICRIVDERGQSASAEGLFYQLIVRLHKFSLGHEDFNASVHWQRGLVLDNYYNGRALLEHLGNDVRITVRAPLPSVFLAVLTTEVKWLVDEFWEGLRCDVMVPCIAPSGNEAPCIGLYEVEKLIDSKRRHRSEHPCPVCNEWQDINCLLQNATAERPTAYEALMTQGFEKLQAQLGGVRKHLNQQDRTTTSYFNTLDQNDQRILSQVDDAFAGLMLAFTDEAKDGPRLFSLEPVDPGFFDRPKWINEKFLLTLWCEHSKLPLPALGEDGDKTGVYTLTLARKWFVKAAPFLKLLAGTLSMVAPVASSATNLVLDDLAYQKIKKPLDLGLKSVDSVLKAGDKVGPWLGHSNTPDLERGESIRAHGAALRQLHVWLKKEDSGFGGLVRVQNNRQEFLWVHPLFEKEY